MPTIFAIIATCGFAGGSLSFSESYSYSIAPLPLAATAVHFVSIVALPFSSTSFTVHSCVCAVSCSIAAPANSIACFWLWR